MDGLSESAWKDIKHQFYYTGRLPKDISPTLPIIEAWKQSKQAGLSPFSEVTSLKKFKIHSFSDHDVKLAQLAESILADILELFGQQEVSTFLINRDFKIIAERHNPFLDQAYHFLQPGRVVEHSVFGAIAPTCSILSKQPMIMVGHQHYLNEFSNYSCASVPIFNGTGEVVGALDITSPKGLLASNWLRHLLYQSYILENKIIMSELKSDERVLYFQHSKDLLENAYSGLIVLNEKNIVIKANRMALKLLNCSVEQLLNHHFSDYFYCHDISHLKFNEPFLIQSQDHAFLYAKIKQVYNKPNLNYSTTSMFDQALKALKADIPLLITGETGVGKDHFAQQLHQSLDKNIPFISINCGAIPDQLLEAELFGHEGGAFTGAKKHGEKGLIELADQGILFLDEIGDLPLALQVKILRVLQDQQFYRVGGRKPIRSAFRLICATHQDLSARIAEKDFRSDLYYRIRGFEVHVQPLRLRHDKYQVFHQILRSLNITQWSAQVETQFENYSWPGNIRELIHVLKLSFAFNQGDILEALHLPQPILNTLEVSNSPQCLSAPSNLTDKTKVFILQVLQEENGNIARTAKRLKISRTTIYKYLDS